MQLEDAKALFIGRAIANYALVHQLAAKEFARQARMVEDANLHEVKIGNFWNAIQLYTTATILTSTAALEAFVNECFLLPNGALRDRISNFDAAFWGEAKSNGKAKRGIEWLPILAKYDKALNLLAEPTLEKISGTTFQHAEALVALRNALVHFKPLYDPPRSNQQELERKLRACGFPLSPYHHANSDFVLQCMTAGCAAWAVQTTADLVGVFAHQIGVNANVADAFK